MSATSVITLKREFESRIFVSLGIVVLVCLGSALTGRGAPSSIERIGALVGMLPENSRQAGFLILALHLTCVSVLRMWAGTELSARRVMAFRVQIDEFHTTGPYCLVRNPIYLADFLAIAGFALCLPPLGLLMPVLFWIHYARLIRYEEASLGGRFSAGFAAYTKSTPRLIPSASSICRLPTALRDLRLTPEGIRHNALYVFFIPGFVAAAVTDSFIVAVLIGIPGVIDWAIVHTRLGVRI